MAAGNVKGMVDYYRTPDTQRAFAEKHDQDARKVTSFADATKLSMETTVLANATGFHVGRRGMYGPACRHMREMANLLRPNQFRRDWWTMLWEPPPTLAPSLWSVKNRR